MSTRNWAINPQEIVAEGFSFKFSRHDNGNTQLEVSNGFEYCQITFTHAGDVLGIKSWVAVPNEDAVEGEREAVDLRRLGA